MSCINNNRPVSNWRDISPEDAKLVLAGKIGLAALGVVLTIGIVIACYYLSKSYAITRNIYDDHCHIIGTRVDYGAHKAPLMILPIINGGFLVGACFFGAAFLNLENEYNGESGDLKNPSVRKHRMGILNKSDFKAVFKFFSKHGGVQPLVQQGLISEEAGKEMSKLFIDYAKVDKKAAEMKNQSSEVVKKQTEAVEQIATIQKEWTALQSKHFPKTSDSF